MPRYNSWRVPIFNLENHQYKTYDCWKERLCNLYESPQESLLLFDIMLQPARLPVDCPISLKHHE